MAGKVFPDESAFGVFVVEADGVVDVVYGAERVLEVLQGKPVSRVGVGVKNGECFSERSFDVREAGDHAGRDVRPVLVPLPIYD